MNINLPLLDLLESLLKATEDKQEIHTGHFAILYKWVETARVINSHDINDEQMDQLIKDLKG